MKTPEEVLDEARQIIETDGWYQGNYIPTPAPDGDGAGAAYEAALRSGPVCSMGAIHRALSGLANSPGNVQHSHLYATVLTKLNRAIGRSSTGIASWNDSRSRTVEDVLLAFKRAVEPE